MKYGLGDSGPFQFATLRFALAAICMVPIIGFYGEPMLPRGRQWRAVLVHTMPFWVLNIRPDGSARAVVVLVGGWALFEPQPINWTASFAACVVYSAMPAAGPAWERWPRL